MNWIPIGLNWTILFKCLEMTIVVIWRYINKTELNWIELLLGSELWNSGDPIVPEGVIIIRVRAVKQRRPYCSWRSYYYYCLRNLRQTTPILAGTPVVGGNEAIWRSRTLAAQNGSIAPPTRLHLHLTNGVILPYPDETRYTPSSCRDAQKRLWTPWCEVNRKSAILSGSCVLAPFLPVSTPRIWSNSSYTFHTTGFKLGHVTLKLWGTKSYGNLSQTLKCVAVAKPQSSTTGHCSPWKTKKLITPTTIVRSSPNFIGCTWAPPRTHTYDQTYTCL